jgi:hypothetical protein
MVCEHLRLLDDELAAAGIEVIYRDHQPWTRNCRAWTRYACYLDLAAIRSRLDFAPCVVDHEYRDIWQGEERGFVCTEHSDAIVGDYSSDPTRPVVT